jgi:hypothetical protein
MKKKVKLVRKPRTRSLFNTGTCPNKSIAQAKNIRRWRCTLNFRLWTRDKVIIAGCTVLFILSAIDRILTLWGLSVKVIEEAN